MELAVLGGELSLLEQNTDYGWEKRLKIKSVDSVPCKRPEHGKF